MKIHEAKCPNSNHERSLQISVDGMSETKSTTVSIDVYSTRMSNCKVVYPLRIVRPLKKYPINHNDQFSAFIKDLQDSSCKIKQYIADNLKRATGKACLNHASSFPCEYCFAKGVRFVLTDNNEKTKKHLKLIRLKLKKTKADKAYCALLEKEVEKAEIMLSKKRSHIVWPASTRNGEPRTVEKIVAITEKIKEKGKLPAEEAKGVIGVSPLMSIPGFDIVRDVPAEYLHSSCLGVSKRMVELTFSVGENRPRLSKRKLSSPSKFNDLMRNVKVVFEFPRRIRDLDFAVLKGQEFRNLTLFFFPVIIKCIDKPALERKLWLQYAYIIRACVVPAKEFNVLDLNVIDATAAEFYKLYEKLFGPNNCTYNTHLVGSHTLEMRVHGPLTMTSAFGFESFYGEIRQSFIPGTQSNLIQIFRKIIMKRILGYHCCENSIRYAAKETKLQNDTMIYCFQDSIHKMFKIVEIYDDYVVCMKQGRYPFTFPEMPNHDFSKIGVYKRGPLSNDKCKIMKNQISGKVLNVHEFLITCPNNVLREK